MGSWLLYGLGCECDDLARLCRAVQSVGGGQSQPIASRDNGTVVFYPDVFREWNFARTGDPVLYVKNPQRR